jgi:protein TonB
MKNIWNIARSPRRGTLAAAILLVVGLPYARAEALKVTEVDAKNAVTKKVTPEYPPLARQMKMFGKVELAVAIDATGDVESASIKLGNPVLGGAAMAAVKKWKFTPFAVDGKPTNAVTVISFDFKP